MEKDREITDELALLILDEAIERCKKALLTLEIGTDAYDNVYMEMRSYQMNKDTLLNGGGDYD